MFLIAGVSPKVKPVGTAHAICPACGRSAALHISKKYSVMTLFFVPVLPFRPSWIATCPSCASVMALHKSKGPLVEKNPHVVLAPEDLEIIRNNCGPVCAACGAAVSRGQNFCPNCGDRL